MLEQVSNALASIRSPVIRECERAFSCRLNPVSKTIKGVQQYESRDLQWGVAHLEIRTGKREGIIVASFKQAIQQELVKQLDASGEIVEIDIVSPPASPASAPAWTRKWSVTCTFQDTRICFGLEERKETRYLLYASRILTLEASELLA